MVKKGRIISFFVILVVLAIVIGLTAKPIVNNIKLGLDLKGGFEVLYQVKPLKQGDKITSGTLHNAVTAIEKRINVIGVSEPSISIEGNDRIRVALPGVKDEKSARKLLSTTANLTFRDSNDKLMIDGSELEPGKAKMEFQNTTNQPIVTLQLKSSKKMEQVTRTIMKKTIPDNVLVIWLDWHKGQTYKEESKKAKPAYISAPRVDEELGKNVMIQGDFTTQEAKNLAELLNAGSLPVKMDEIYSQSVGPQFGKDSMVQTLYGGTIGVAIIFLFMLVFYRFGGLIANITLCAYIYAVIAVFVGLQAVLTLPGIAALILGIGMAVDANIITLERIKDELRSGKSVLSAFRAGNHRSFSTVLDSNLTTIIAAAVLFVFGTSAVRGFAIMLIISNVVTFITSVFGARWLLGLWVHGRALDKKPGLLGVKKGDVHDA